MSKPKPKMFKSSLKMDSPAFQSMIQQLINEGYDKTIVINALSASMGNIEEARNFLIGSQAVPLFEPSKKTINMGKILLDSETTCDCTVLIGKDHTAIRIHKAIMAGNSEIFEKMFFSKEEKVDLMKEPMEDTSLKLPSEDLEMELFVDDKLKEKVVNNEREAPKLMEDLKEELKGNERVVEDNYVFEEMEPSEFKSLKEYCYTGVINFPSFEIGMRIYDLANKLKMNELKKEVVTLITTFLNPDNSLRAFFDTVMPGYSTINEGVKKSIEENATAIFSQNKVLNRFTDLDILTLLGLKLNVNEDIILERVIEYANNKLPIDMKKANRKREMAPITSHIQLEKLGPNGIKKARSSGLFKSGKILDVILSGNLLKDTIHSQKH